MIRRFLRWLIGSSEPAANVELPLAAQVAVLKAELEAMKQEWSDVQDWLHRWQARENARKRRAVKAALGEAEGEGYHTTSGGEIVEPAAPGAPGPSRKAYLRSLVHRNGR